MNVFVWWEEVVYDNKVDPVVNMILSNQASDGDLVSVLLAPRSS